MTEDGFTFSRSKAHKTTLAQRNVMRYMSVAIFEMHQIRLGLQQQQQQALLPGGAEGAVDPDPPSIPLLLLERAALYAT